VRQQWNVDELTESWLLDSKDLELVRNKTGTTRLGFAVLLKFFELEARFPLTGDEIPVEVVDFVARQVGIEVTDWREYDWTGRSWIRHRRQIRSHFSFGAWASSNIEPLTAALADRVNEVGADRAKLAEQGYGWCRQHRVEPPTPSRLDRFVGSAIRRWEERTALDTLGRLSGCH